MGPTHEGVGISALSSTATLQLRAAGAMAYTLTFERHWENEVHREAEPVANVEARHNA